MLRILCTWHFFFIPVYLLVANISDLSKTKALEHEKLKYGHQIEFELEKEKDTFEGVK